MKRAIDTFEETDVPVTADEIIQAVKNLKDSAPGLDEMKKCDLNKIAPEDMATHTTLWLFSGCPPDALKKGIVTCVKTNKTRNTQSRRFQTDHSWTNHWQIIPPRDVQKNAHTPASLKSSESFHARLWPSGQNMASQSNHKEKEGAEAKAEPQPSST